MYFLQKIISFIGYQGPNTLLISILLVLYLQKYTTQTKFYTLVIVWQIVNHLLNVTIKNTLRLPRPDSNLAELAKLKPTVLNYLFIHDNYGMPSGHAQSVVSLFVFIALFFRQKLFTFLAFLQVLITLWQRYATKRHSLQQLAVGSGVGLVSGLSFYGLINYLLSINKLSINKVMIKKSIEFMETTRL
jgi:membrane-associated phospholipid phosphatase